MTDFPLPAGVSRRSVALRDGDGPDVATVWRVADAHERAVLGRGETSRDEIRSLLTGPLSPPDGQVLVERSGVAIGALSIEVDADRREVFADAYADPADPAAPGVLRSLAAWAVGYARTAARRDPAPEGVLVPDPYQPHRDVWQVAAGCYEEDRVYAEALAANGLRRIRRHWQMHLDLRRAGTAATDPDPPPGIRRVVAASDAEVRDLHAVYADSFRDHFGSGPMAFDAWLPLVRALPGADPQRWWLALDGEVPVGMCLLDDSRVEFGDAYVRTLGVAREARGRGIARWLLGCAFADAVRRGMSGVALTVDSASPTGATRLYEGMGMTRRRVIDAWCRPVGTAADP